MATQQPWVCGVMSMLELQSSYGRLALCRGHLKTPTPRPQACLIAVTADQFELQRLPTTKTDRVDFQGRAHGETVKDSTSISVWQVYSPGHFIRAWALWSTGNLH